MHSGQPVFAFNHMTAPNLGIDAFFAMAKSLGVDAVEIRNDIAGNAILDGTKPAEVNALAQKHGVRILSINGLQRFNEWTDAREAEAIELADYAQACGAEALVLVPKNDGTGLANGERQANLRVSLKVLTPILAARGLLGLVEPLGFEICSLRQKSEAVDAIEALGLRGKFKLVHDTFHHYLAGNGKMFPEHTGLVHISGVSDGAATVSEMLDKHRVLIDGTDRINNVGQIAALLDAGVRVPMSYEPFAREVHNLPDLAGAVQKSMEFIKSQLSKAAA